MAKISHHDFFKRLSVGITFGLAHLRSSVLDSLLDLRGSEALASVAAHGLQFYPDRFADVHPKVRRASPEKVNLLHPTEAQALGQLIGIKKMISGRNDCIHGQKPGRPMVGMGLIGFPGVVSKNDGGLMLPDYAGDFFP